MRAAILFCVVALTAAQEPRPCLSPAQFEGRLLSRDFSKNFTQFAKLSYDETNRRVREIEELQIGADREFFDVLYLHNENREYRLNLRDRKCNITSLTRPFVPFGVPREARYDGEFNIGPVNIPGEHVDVVSFEGKNEDGEFRGEVTRPDCLPVHVDFFSNRTGFFHRTFFDLTIGIPDPTVFNPPSECR